MKKNLDYIAEVIATRIRKLEPIKQEGWISLVYIEQLLTPYGKSVEGLCAPALREGLGTYKILNFQNKIFNAYHERLYTSSIKANSGINFISLQGRVSGYVRIEIFAENEDGLRLISATQSSGEKDFISPDININELMSGDSLFMKVIPLCEDVVLEGLVWRAKNSSAQCNSGLRIVAIRTYGNKNTVQDNLNRLSNYLKIKKIELKNYLFIVYDATGNNDPLDIHDGLNIIYLKGGNYGGGGNASVLTAAIFRAQSLCPNSVIDELMLCDDDAVIEPQIFIRHNGFVSFRNFNVSHTGIVLSKSSPDKIQEYGGYWGAFFDLENGEIGLNQEKSRQIHPYLVRFNRNVLNEWDRKYIGSSQAIEFSTFIYFSIPFNLLLKAKGIVPFFLRNDDVELGFRLSKVGGVIICNQNIFTWHEATHNISGEFYAAFHGMVVNSAYCNLDRYWVIKQLMKKVVDICSVKNIALLEAYKQAIISYVEGPHWTIQKDVFEVYLKKVNILNRRLSNYRQVPLEVVEILKKQSKIEIHALTNSAAKSANVNLGFVFYDAPNKRYLSLDKSQEHDISDLVSDIAILIGKLSSNFDIIKKAWTSYINQFDCLVYWDNFYLNSESCLEQGKVIISPRKLSNLSIYIDGEEVNHEQLFLQKVDTNEFSPNRIPDDFDEYVYYKLNPDVEESKINALEHYLKFGINENRRYR